jgi:hypothetical protein
MDLRLRTAARMPLVSDGLRITVAGRERMLAALARSGLTSLVRALAERYGLDAGGVPWEETPEPDGHNNSRFTAHQIVASGPDGRHAILASAYFDLPGSYRGELLGVVDLRIDFDAIRPSPATASVRAPTSAEPAHIPHDLGLTRQELIGVFEQSWRAATEILPLAAAEHPLEIPPAGAPRLELYIQNERPEMSGSPRTLRTLDMVDLSAFGRTRQTQIRDLSVGVTAPLGLPEEEIGSLVRQALVHLAEDFGFTDADMSRV